MREIIIDKIKQIEIIEDVRILHAVESGSRAWGFESPDSDYDVRFIYVRQKDFYLRLDKTRDVIEWQLDDILDINGWDIQKVLRLLHSSNPTLFEWNSSPVVYKTTPEWSEIQDEIKSYFSTKSGLYHYFNTAKSNYHAFLTGDTVKLKKYLYVLRPILACKWILDKKCPPPVLFSELAEAQLEQFIKPVISQLVERKRKTPEIGEYKRIDVLNEYIEEQLEILKESIDALPNEHGADWNKLNSMFLNILNHVSDNRTE